MGWPDRAQRKVSSNTWMDNASRGKRLLTAALMLLLPAATAFAIAVMGPRIAAGGTTDWRFWVTRFALFACAASAGAL